MAMEIATAAQTASLMLAPTSEAANLLTNVKDERELSDEQFSLVARIAAGPPPALPTVTDDDMRKLIGTMAGTLKAPRSSSDEGRLKLAVYKRMLGHLPLAALQHATHTALATLEWMPTPAEILKLAEKFTAPERFAHARAQRLARDRRQRIFEETLRNCKDHTLSHDELQALPDHVAQVAQTQASIIIRSTGERVYRTRETVQADLKEREEIALARRDERDKRAEEAPELVKSSETVGDLAAGLLAGMEVSDGKA